MKTSGLAWHCHHDILLEYVYDFNERVDAIKSKDKSEVEARLRLFKFISDSALKLFPKEILEADQKWKEANQKWKEAGQKWDETYRKRGEAYQKRYETVQEWEEAYQKRHKAYLKRYETYRKRDEAYQKRQEANQKLKEAYQKWREEIEKIHSQDCGCKEWNGTEIVFEEEKQ